MKKNAAAAASTLSNDIGPIHIQPTQQETDRLRSLAERWMDIANSPIMDERKRLWKALHDLKMERPMILVEWLGFFRPFVLPELVCIDPYLKNVEMYMLQEIKHYTMIQDDIVFEPYFRLPWRVLKSHGGVQIHETTTAEGALIYHHPIQKVEELSQLKPRDFYVDRERTLCVKNALERIYGNILPVRVGNFDNCVSSTPDLGFNPLTGNFSPTLVGDLFRLVGNETMMYWTYDEPDAIRNTMRFILDDKLRFLQWLKQEKLLDCNTDNQAAAPSGYGYVSDLPAVGTQETVDVSDCWAWCESQESIVFSPEMFQEFFLPYIAEYANHFGLVTYGCCEPLEDRIESIKKAVPKLRTVSVTGWNKSYEALADSLGRDYVFCRKPAPSYMSGKYMNWDKAREDIEKTWACTKDKNVGFIFRDLVDICNDITRITDWVQMVQKIVGM